MSDGEAFYPRARILVSLHSECMDHEKDNPLLLKADGPRIRFPLEFWFPFAQGYT